MQRRFRSFLVRPIGYALDVFFVEIVKSDFVHPGKKRSEKRVPRSRGVYRLDRLALRSHEFVAEFDHTSVPAQSYADDGVFERRKNFVERLSVHEFGFFFAELDYIRFFDYFFAGVYRLIVVLKHVFAIVYVEGNLDFAFFALFKRFKRYFSSDFVA